MKRKSILLTTFFFALLVGVLTPITASAREHHRFHVYFSYGSPGYYGYYYQPAPAYYYYQPEPEYYYYEPQPSYYYYGAPRYRYYRLEGRGRGRFEHSDRGRHRGWYKDRD
jgi:hypothetical protein